MATVISIKSSINVKSRQNKALEGIRKFLPLPLREEIDRLFEVGGADIRKIEEIRLRSNKRAYLTVGGKEGRGTAGNMQLSTVLSSEQIGEILGKMCDGSLYAYGESIIKGYITLSQGVRVGICGRASVEKNKILGIYNIQALNIRLPCEKVSPDKELVELIRKSVRAGEGVLIYSPPAQGKTTLLRSLAAELAGGARPMRVALVDTREEIGGFLEESGLSLDILSGYPQAEGIRIATAFMNPEIIICDEIGSEEDAIAIAGAQNCGVPLIATAHGATADRLLQRRGINLLHQSGAFGLYIGIRIAPNGFEYRAVTREEAELENNRNSFASV